MSQDQGRLASIGCKVSGIVAHISAHPYVQLGFIVACLIWLATGFSMEALTLALSMLAITLTQMVLNSQEVRENDARRRDVALHAKLDELIIATKEARDEIAGIEELEEADIAALREAVNVSPLPTRAARPRRAAAS